MTSGTIFCAVVRYFGMEYIFENRDRVRDYECDLQGIVNNANYQHYLEHSRHLYCESRGMTFSEMHAEGIDVVVARFTISYKSPLHPDDWYVCRLRVEKEGVRYVFYQDIYREADNKLCVSARVDCVVTIGGRLASGHPKIDALL